MKPVSTLKFPRGVYGITPDWSDTAKLLDAVRLAAEGGMAALQWRRKTGEEAERLEQARELSQLCRELGVTFIVNDSVETGLKVDADGVHLGRDDGSWHAARAALGSAKLLGCSCYNRPDLAREALDAGADYIAFGAMYPSGIKPDAVRASLEHIRQGRQLADAASPRATVVAIGGITVHNARPLIEAGADSIALISGLFEVPDIYATALDCSRLFDGALS